MVQQKGYNNTYDVQRQKPLMSILILLILSAYQYDIKIVKSEENSDLIALSGLPLLHSSIIIKEVDIRNVLHNIYCT